MKYKIRKCSCGYWAVLEPGAQRRGGILKGTLSAERATFAGAWAYLDQLLAYETTQ